MKPTAVTSRCVAVVMSRSDGDRPGVSTGCTPENGYDIFRQFLSENQRIVWNPHVTYSIQSVDFVGFVRPGTLFLSGAEQHLECLRNAWARRLLKPPVGFTIKSVASPLALRLKIITNSVECEPGTANALNLTPSALDPIVSH
ncbi:unnamed protein product [Soboliphyme baturini]|uniref:Storkhead-box protein 1 n=1 Tax=Soboliphyme baturini TaxID=241478 RepID=A0A183IBL4_9BILA|nr:unnamed protein product [Soboliphyme baturini]